MKQSRYIFIITMAMMLLMACANLGTPDGGPYDETPPHVVHTSPKFGQMGATPKKITLLRAPRRRCACRRHR